MSAPASRTTDSGTYSRPFFRSPSMSCQKLVSCSAVHTASECASSCALAIARDSQHQPPDRIGRSPAVIEQIVPGLVARHANVLTKGVEQVVEQRTLETETARSCPTAHERSPRRQNHQPAPCRRPRRPVAAASRREARGARPASGALVGKVVCDARERVDRGDVRPRRLREQARRDGKIFVVLLRQLQAAGVSGGCYHSVSASPAR